MLQSGLVFPDGLGVVEGEIVASNSYSQSELLHVAHAPVRRTKPKLAPRILAIIPAHNEENKIAECLTGIYEQTDDFIGRDIVVDILLVSDNSKDKTVGVAKKTAKKLEINILNSENGTTGKTSKSSKTKLKPKVNLLVMETKNNKNRKPGALNEAYSLIYGKQLEKDLYGVADSKKVEAYRQSIKAIFCMDADSRLAVGALRNLWDELMSSPNIGGVMARYTMQFLKPLRAIQGDPHYEKKNETGQYGGYFSQWLISVQKQDMASWLIDLNTRRAGSTYVLGGQASLFRPRALAKVVKANQLPGPWDPTTSVEDMKLTWQLQEQGFKTLVSRSARCYVDAMSTVHTFVQQRLKWTGGLVDLLTEQDRVKTRHRWYLWQQQLKSALDLSIRLLFIPLVFIGIATSQFIWVWWWVIPPLIASILNIQLALKTPEHRPIDIFLAATLVSPEIYLDIQLVTWMIVWWRKFTKQEKDGWTDQYKAQEGLTRSKLPDIIAVGIIVVGGLTAWAVMQHDWFNSPAVQQATEPFLVIGFWILSILTAICTLGMLRRIFLMRTSSYRP